MKNLFKKIKDGLSITDDEVVYLMTCFNINEASETQLNILSDIDDWAKETFERWDDFNDQFPNNPHYVGVVINGKRYITGYTGVVGNYWLHENHTMWLEA